MVLSAFENWNKLIHPAGMAVFFLLACLAQARGEDSAQPARGSQAADDPYL
jgi:hypothetical protein